MSDLIGPINISAGVMFVSIQNKIPFVLNGFQDSNNNIIYYWDSSFDSISISAPNLPVFTTSGNINDLLFSDTVNGGGIRFFSNEKTIGNSPLPLALKIKQNSFASWFPPVLFLAGVEYTILTPSGGTADIFTTTSSTGPTIPADNIMMLPINWYANCTSSGSYDQINTPSGSLENWFCNLKSFSTCPSSLLKGGWTNLTDCEAGVDYQYCPVGDICGNNTCKGPCTEIYYDCKYDQGNFVCVFDPLNFFTETQWYTSPYFIITSVGIFVLIIIFVIIIIISLYYVVVIISNRINLKFTVQ